jgi:hypothetical protein
MVAEYSVRRAGPLMVLPGLRFSLEMIFVLISFPSNTTFLSPDRALALI